MNASICTLILVLLTVFDLSAQSDWPMINGGRNRRSWAQNETSLAPPFQYTVVVPTGSSPSTLTCENRMLFVGFGGTPNMVRAIRLSSRDSIWTFRIPNTGGAIDNTPAITGSLVLVGGQNSDGLYALDRSSGSMKWMKPVGQLYNRHAITDEGRVYVSGNNMYCLDADTGGTIWSVPQSTQTTPCVDEAHVYHYAGGKITARSKLNGQPVWELLDASDEGLAADEKNLYTTAEGKVRAVNKMTGASVWSYSIPGGKSLAYLDGDAIAVSDDHLCGVLWENERGNAELFTLDKQTGSLLWQKEFPFKGIYTPTIANNLVYVVCYGDHALYGFQVQTGVQLFMNNSFTFKNQPIVADNTLFACVSDGVIGFRNQPVSVEWNLSGTTSDLGTLHQNYPNPFSHSTTISYNLSVRSHVRLEVVDLLGRNVATLVDEVKEAGKHAVEFNASAMMSGVYLCTLSAGGDRRFGMIVVRK